MNRIGRGLSAVWHSPLVWGGVSSLGFYSLYHGQVIRGEFVRRYFAGHPVNYCETVCFFVALAALVIKGLDVFGQRSGLRQLRLPASPREGLPPEASEELLAEVCAWPASAQVSYAALRLKSALEFVRQQGSADRLDDELKYLADSDRLTAHGSYALVRLVIWAIPILGFLGTVIGITMAIAELSPEALEESLPEVTSGLGVAFDTTALALGLSMILMFVQYVVDKSEQALLAAVDGWLAHALAGRFQVMGGAQDPQVAQVKRIADAMVLATERLVQQQAELWRATIDEAHQRWTQLTAGAHEVLEQSLVAGLTKSLESHARELALGRRQGEEQRQRTIGDLKLALDHFSTALVGQQTELARQGDVLLQVVDATGQVARLEEALNRNLQALAGERNFEETLHSLSAAIHLLTARLGGAPAASSVEIRRGRSGSHAA